MNSISLAGIALLVVFVVLIVSALISYMSSLVKNAYQIKVEIRSEMEDGMRRMSEDSERWIRATKRELLDEVAKGRLILENENTRHFSELAEAIKKQITDLDDAVRSDRTKATLNHDDLRRRMDDLRARMGDVEHIYRSITRARKPEKDKPDEASPVPVPVPVPDLDPTQVG